VKSPKDQADRQSQNRLPLHSVIKPTTNQNDDFFDSIDPTATLSGRRTTCLSDIKFDFTCGAISEKDIVHGLGPWK
jgi:hypothetical protein